MQRLGPAEEKCLTIARSIKGIVTHLYIGMLPSWLSHGQVALGNTQNLLKAHLLLTPVARGAAARNMFDRVDQLQPSTAAARAPRHTAIFLFSYILRAFHSHCTPTRTTAIQQHERTRYDLT